MTPRRPHRWREAAANLALIVLLLVAVSFLPPDTSLAERRALGVLKLCVPTLYPPLVTGDASKPGFDIELADALAQGIGVRLVVNVLPSIGRDFNPRNWQLTRAQCDVVGGGVTDTVQTRGFLQTLPTPAQTGWVAIAPGGRLPPDGARVAVLPGSSGLDRLALSAWLRQHKLRAVLVRDAEELIRTLTNKEAEAAFTERFVAASVATLPTGMTLAWLPAAELPRYPMALGLWKGDQTLKRAIEAQYGALAVSGALAALQEKYGLNGVVGELAQPL